MALESTSHRTKMTFIAFLILFVILLYIIDLFEFNMDDWDLRSNRIPQIIVVSAPLNASFKTSTIEQSTITTLYEPKISKNFSKLFINEHNIINGNPFEFKECRNAILNKENENIQDFVSQHTSHLNRDQREGILKHMNDIIWSRELIHALRHKLKYGHLVRIRLSYDANNQNWQGSRARQRNESLDGFTSQYRLNNNINKQSLVYYHISKCGSSSIHNMLNTHYNTTRMYWRDLLDIDSFRVLPDIDCGFTFIRNPIDRVISGFYTILSMLNREFEHQSNGDKDEKERIVHKYGLLHPWFTYNGSKTIRFKLFVEEIIEKGYEYVITDHLMLHVVSQIGSGIGNFHSWPIHFMGRMEYFEENWYVLTMEHERCSKVFESVSVEKDIHSLKIMHAMKRSRHNSIDSEDMNGDKDRKIEYQKKGLSAEHFAFIDYKQLFYRTVDYFYQDFVCFGYNMTHEGYMKHLNDKYYI